jgi:ribosome recycling factor
MNIVYEHRDAFEKCIEHLKHEVSGLRTGRATTALVEDIMVEAYGVKQPLKAVASISVPDAKTLAIEPWDKSILAAVESGIRNSQLGINPVNDGKLLRLPLPELTTERRQELIKVLHQKLEAARIAIRGVREDAKKMIELAEKDGDIPEDDKYKQVAQLEEVVKEYNEKIKNVGTEKEQEINKV